MSKKNIFQKGVTGIMCRDPLYYEGYIAGYRDGVKDCVLGKTEDWRFSDIGKMPVRAMRISTRAHNCLIRYGCVNVGDVIALSKDSIMRMRNMGTKTAAEIAQWMIDHGILASAWSEYL